MRVGPYRIPDDLDYVGLILDRSHARLVGDIIRLTKNEQSSALLSQFRRMDHAEFLVLACDPMTEKAGAVGGLAASRDDAVLLFRMCQSRLDAAATASDRDLTGAWMLMCSPENERAFRASAAESGHAVDTPYYH